MKRSIRVVHMGTPGSRGVLRFEAEPPARVAVLRALQLGDLLCAVPALRGLRTALPASHISLVGLPWARDFVARFPGYLDEFIEFPGYPGLPEREFDVRAIPPFFAAMQDRRLDLAIQMQGDGSVTNAVVALFGATRMAGYRLPAVRERAGAHLAEYPSCLPEPQRHLYLVEWLTGFAGPDHLEFPIRRTEDDEWRHLARAEGLRRGAYACVHAGARDPRRRWPIERFAEVAASLMTCGLRVVLTGDASEEPIVDAVARACPAPVTSIAGRTSLGALAAAIRDARLLVTNDTGVSHIAAATRTPSVVVFLVTDPARWAPTDHRRHRVVGAGAVAVRDVLREADRVMAEEGARA